MKTSGTERVTDGAWDRVGYGNLIVLDGGEDSGNGGCGAVPVNECFEEGGCAPVAPTIFLGLER